MKEDRREQGKPQLSKGQVWRSRKHPRIIYEIERIDGRAVVWTHGGWDDLAGLRGFYECIGIETPAGRVMVGERRQPPLGSDPSTVLAIRDAGVRMSLSGGATVTWPAALVATWPLLPPEPAQWDRVSIGGISCPVTITRSAVRGNSPDPIGRTRGIYATVVDIQALNMPPLSQAEADALADRLGLRPAPPDPRAAREQRRRAISAVLAEDARRHPAFATARRCAVMAWAESFDMAFHALKDGAPDAIGARPLLAGLHTYEARRGGMREPRAGAADDSGINLRYVAVYERSRGLP